MVICSSGYRIALDGNAKGSNVNFVSHAHSDHISGIKNGTATFASEETRELLLARYGIMVKEEPIPKSIRLLNAGHILGSKQLYAETEESGTIIYSGDYQVRDSPLSGKLEIRNADALIIDSTYPYPDISFDPCEEVLSNIQHLVRTKGQNRDIVLGAGCIGKAQELTKALNEIGIQPIVDKRIGDINGVYERHGFRLDYCRMGDAPPRGCGVFLSEPKNVRHIAAELSSSAGAIPITAVVTGLANLYDFGYDFQFALSDHADFNSAIEYIDRCSPKAIYTVGKEAAAFAHNLRTYGYNASPARNANQVECSSSGISLASAENRGKI
jgi:putative mRNA 3-end processing factor